MSNKKDWSELNEKIITCKLCPRLVAWREETARVKKRAYQDWVYWGKPVPGFGDENARVLIVGLAPGAHGSNRTGRMFTGDASGEFLYRALYKRGFANLPKSVNRKDGLRLKDVFISAVCRCVPPDNHPTPKEILNCQPYLLEEIRLLKHLKGVVALGAIAYKRMQVIYQMLFSKEIEDPFSHGGWIAADRAIPWLMGSYHPSRQNTQTKRLTEKMFDGIWEKVDFVINGEKP